MYGQRIVIIFVVLLVLAGIGFYVVANSAGARLGDASAIAAVKRELRALAAAQDSFRLLNPGYAINVGAMWGSRAESAGVQLRILQADSSGFLAEGRHNTWRGHCVVALGRFTGDSLRPGEPLCHG
jgi:hypothetical protein